MRTVTVLIAIAVLLCAAPSMAQKVSDNFYVTIGAGNVISGGGSGFGGGEWYVYPSMWINEWFYDHPFDPMRGKIIHVEFDWTAYDPACTTDITVAINWSTPAWSMLGHGASLPPIPGYDENMYIVRETVLHECGVYPQTQHFSTDFVITEYNPEWVSIDVMGCNFVITNGVIDHECAVGTEESSWGGIKEMFR